MLERTLDNNNRLATYGSLLSERQRQIMMDYFWYDLSLNEIAEKMNITKQAVSDHIRRAESHLEEMENNLQIIAKKEELQEVIYDISKSLDVLNGKLALEDQKLVNEIKRKLNEVIL